MFLLIKIGIFKRLEFPNSNFIQLWWSSGKMLCLLHRWRGFDSRTRHLWQAKFGHELHWWRDSLKLCWTCLSFTKNQTTWTLYPLNTKSGCNTLGIRTGSPSDLESFPSLLKLVIRYQVSYQPKNSYIVFFLLNSIFFLFLVFWILGVWIFSVHNTAWALWLTLRGIVTNTRDCD